MPAQDDHDRFTGIAEELGLEGDEASNFVSSAMKRKGYKAVTSWADNDDDGDDNESGDFFTSRRKGSKSGEGRRRVDPRGQGGRRTGTNGADWQYRD